MKKKLYLHIGAHKTGSTSIQSFMSENRDRLAAQGILYPDLKMRGFGHHGLAWATGMGPRRPRNELLIPFWIDQIVAMSRGAPQREHTGEGQSWDIHTVVLSSEEFEYVYNTKEIGRLSEFFDVKVVAYLRKQDDYLESAYNQCVRMYDQRFSGSIYQFALTFNSFARYNYRFLLDRWAEVFGSENILVRPYATQMVGGDVRADFLRIVGAGPAGLSYPAMESERDNVSLHARAVPYLARLNEVNLPAPVHRQIILILQEAVPRVAHARLLTHEESTRFYQSFENSNRLVFEQYLGSSDDPFSELARKEVDGIYVDHDEIDFDFLSKMLRQSQAAPSILDLFRGSAS